MSIKKDAFVLTFSKGIRGILLIVFNMIIARNLSIVDFGTYKLINLILNLCVAVFTFGIPTTISYYYINMDKKSRNVLVSNSIILLSLMSLISIIILNIFKKNIVDILNNSQLYNYIYILSIYIFIMIISSLLENLYIASGKTNLLGRAYVVYIIANFIILTTSLLVQKSLMYLILFTVIIELIRTVYMFYEVLHIEKFKFYAEKIAMINQLKFAIPLAVVSMIQNINSYIDNIFISHYFSPSKYALYANAASDIPLVGIITVSVATVILPSMSKVYNTNKDFKGVKEIWGNSCLKVATVLFPIFWILLIFRSGYIQFIFSKKYMGSVPIFTIYLLKFPTYITVYGNILIVLAKQKVIMCNMLIGVFLNCVFNYIFIHIIGFNGAAISAVLVQYFIIFLQLIQISKFSGVKIKELLPYKLLLKIFFIPGLISIFIYALVKISNLDFIIGMFTFGIIIYLLSMFIYLKLNLISLDYVEKLKYSVWGKHFK